MFKRFIEDTKKYFKYVIYAGQTELNAEVADSYLNWLWWVIEPICFMFIYSFVFGTLYGKKEPNFNIFIYIGITMWDYFARMLKTSVHTVKSHKAIVAKVYLPKFILIYVKMYVNAFKMMICFLILVAMLIVEGVSPTRYLVFVLPIVLVEFIFTFGVCTILLHYGVYIDDLSNIIGIVLKMMFYLTGVFYNLQGRLGKTIGGNISVIIGHVNPMANMLTAMRCALLYGTMPEWQYLILWTILGLVMSVIGIRLIYNNENSYVKVI